jgi:hypothetical protein
MTKEITAYGFTGNAHLNSSKEDSRVGFNDGANASLVMETMLSSAFVWRKSYSTNMCNLNDLCQLIKKVRPTFALLSVQPTYNTRNHLTVTEMYGDIKELIQSPV